MSDNGRQDTVFCESGLVGNPKFSSRMRTSKLNGFLTSIYNYVHLNASFDDRVGVSNGKAAAVLMFSNSNQEFYRDHISYLFLNECISQLNVYTPASFGEGIAGIGVLVEYMTRESILETDPNIVLEELELSIFEHLAKVGPWNQSVNNGLSGFGLYLLHRYMSSYMEEGRKKIQILAMLHLINSRIKKLELPVVSNRIDVSIDNGVSGLYLFNHMMKRSGSGLNISPVIKSLDHLLIPWLNQFFEWGQVELYFAMLYSANATTSTDMETLLDSFEVFLEKGLKQIPQIDFYNAAYYALLIRILGKMYKSEKPLVVCSLIMEHVEQIIQKETISRLYPYRDTNRSISIGLDRGITKLALSLDSLLMNNYAWLKIYGITLDNHLL